MHLLKYLHITLFLLFCGPSALRAGSGPNKLQRDVPDAFKAYGAFPYAVAITDSNNDTIFECLAAERTEFDYEAKTATYIWFVSDGPEKSRNGYPFYYTEGPTLDSANYVVGKDGVSQVEYVRYTDYKDCLISEASYFGEQCTLWVSKEVQDLVPEHCLEQFGDICGFAVPVYAADLCEEDFTFEDADD
ncbi:uncharacterized protein LOC144147178 isoform X3 [Haemaphysalis longicornis]